MNTAFRLFGTLVIPLLLAATTARAEPSPQHSPQICIGYYPQLGAWGHLAIPPVNNFINCPNNWALYGLMRPSGDPPDGKYVFAVGSCCPLPADDILLDTHVSASEYCPANHVATGGTTLVGNKQVKPDNLMRCTRINTERYQLSQTREGFAWGALTPNYFEKRVLKRIEIPAAIRFAITRPRSHVGEREGCLGSPIGALLVAKTGKKCSQFLYQELQFRGINGDPQAGTPVQMFPECRDIDDPDDPNARCIRYPRE